MTRAKTSISADERIAVTSVAKLYGTTAEMSAMYGLSAAYLKKLRLLGQGPAYRKCGRLVLYSLSDFAIWFESFTVSVTPSA